MDMLSPDEPWAVTEFADAELGDLRRTQRLVELATVLAQRPSVSLPEACGGDRALLKATYRCFDNGTIAPQELLQSHSDATLLRLGAVPLILAVQDTTEVDWTAHPTTTGLGPLTHPAHRGLHVHTTLAFTPERLPLGLLAQAVWARDPAAVGQKATRKQRAIADKESHKWLESLHAVSAARAACPQTRFISIGDREADVYALFLVARPPGVEVLVRAAWDRCVAHPEQSLWAAIATAPAAATLTVQVPRRKHHAARPATLTLRFGPVTLRPPRHRARERLPLVPVWVVQVLEERPPEGAEPVEWLLLSTAAVPDVATATTCVDWYGGRWGIEVWHKILKSGCQIEARQLGSAAGLTRCLVLYSVIAWRIFYATMLGRTVPDVPCTVLLELEEWQALYCAIHQTPTPPATPPSLRQALHWIAQLGGFLAHRKAGEPGVTVLWKGFQHLLDLTIMYRIMPSPPSEVKICG